MRRVRIRGNGVAARCCEHLLREAGHEVFGEHTERPRLPAIMLSDASIALIEDVFGRKGLFGGFHRIRKRVVAWGVEAQPVTLEHSAVVVSEKQLLDCVRGEELTPGEDADWTVFTSRPLPAEAAEYRFGSRMARALHVGLKGDADSCWIESLAGGWLFLIPDGPQVGWLLAVGAASETLLERSRLIAGKVEILGEAAEFPAYPRIVSPLCATGWIACGSAAMAFDPLCGDGTANAVREAILASAVIGAGPDAFEHYHARLIAGFQKHLALCVNFYRSGSEGPWWEQEAAALQQGLDWCALRASGFGSYRYKLSGFQLVPVLT
jgi:hypothetical protein